LHAQGRLDEAEAEYRAVLEAFTRVLGADHPDTVDTRNNLGVVLETLGRLDEAAAESRAVLNARSRMLGTHQPDIMRPVGNHAAPPDVELKSTDP
jgi:hypothetical protein